MQGKNKFLIMAGGTGGHVFPALAIADKLRERGDTVLWLGTRGRMEEQLVPKHGFEIEYIDVKGLRRNGVKAKLKAPFMILRALWQARAVIKKYGPDCALGMGGYASGPGGLMCRLMGIPLVLHEQNAAAGLTNRLLFKVANLVLLGFPGAFAGEKVSVVGNPVRADLVAMYSKKRDFSGENLRILILGGSLGAKALNELVPKALSLFKDGGIEVTHQCGKGNSGSVSENYAGAPFKVTVSDFIDDMAGAYRDCDLIICRAGASTVAEVACVGLPAVFIPLPTAVDDHQTKNAGVMQQRGAALVCPQAALTPEDLYLQVRALRDDREGLERMSEAAYACAITDSASQAVAKIDELLESRSKK